MCTSTTLDEAYNASLHGDCTQVQKCTVLTATRTFDSDLKNIPLNQVNQTTLTVCYNSSLFNFYAATYLDVIGQLMKLLIDVNALQQRRVLSDNLQNGLFCEDGLQMQDVVYCATHLYNHI